MRFSRHAYWGGLPCPLPGDLPGPEMEPASLIVPELAGRFFTTVTWEARAVFWFHLKMFPLPHLHCYLSNPCPLACGSSFTTWKLSTNAACTIVGTRDRYQFARKFGKLSRCHRTGRSQFSLPVPRKGNAKECSSYHTVAFISHASKVMLKILQARLQQYVDRELPDVQAGFRKGRGTRDQIANIH